jgi:uncharacterized protein (TIGR02186 family)
MKMSSRARQGLAGAGLILASLIVFGIFNIVEAQRRTQGSPQLITPPTPAEQPARRELQAQATPAPPPSPQSQRETVQADVSTRSVAVTSSFTGTEIVVFGAVDNSRQQTAESGFYDIVIVIEGTPTRLVARRKSNVAGIWLNTQSLTFESVPSYYTILSTRPLDEVANPIVLRENDIGFEHVRMMPVQGWETGLTTADLEDFKNAVVRLKQKDGLYVQEEYGVAFIGRSLFRAAVDLPANVPVGPLDVRVYLFRDGQLLSNYTARVRLEREGIERLLHNFAFGRPFLYGLFTVSIAVGSGLLASAFLRRAAH